MTANRSGNFIGVHWADPFCQIRMESAATCTTSLRLHRLTHPLEPLFVAVRNIGFFFTLLWVPQQTQPPFGSNWAQLSVSDNEMTDVNRSESCRTGHCCRGNSGHGESDRNRQPTANLLRTGLDSQTPRLDHLMNLRTPGADLQPSRGTWVGRFAHSYPSTHTSLL